MVIKSCDLVRSFTVLWRDIWHIGRTKRIRMKILKWIIVYLIVAPVFYIMTFPICSLIALMDWGNGKTYKENLREVMGIKQQ